MEGVKYVEYTIGHETEAQSIVTGTKGLIAVKFLLSFEYLEDYFLKIRLENIQEHIVGFDIFGDETTRRIRSYKTLVTNLKILKDNSLGVRIHLGEGIRIDNTKALDGKENCVATNAILMGLLFINFLKYENVQVRIGHGCGVVEVLEHPNFSDYVMKKTKSGKYMWQCLAMNDDVVAKFQLYFSNRKFKAEEFKYQFKNVLIEVCPSSNIVLCSSSKNRFLNMNDLHGACPLVNMVYAGYKVCLGSDDPAIHQNQPIRSRIVLAMNELPQKTIGIITAEEQIAGYLLGQTKENFIIKMRVNAFNGKFSSCWSNTL
jgi:uncharacterized protein YegP (UPF0339 family)